MNGLTSPCRFGVFNAAAVNPAGPSVEGFVPTMIIQTEHGDLHVEGYTPAMIIQSPILLDVWVEGIALLMIIQS